MAAADLRRELRRNARRLWAVAGALMVGAVVAFLVWRYLSTTVAAIVAAVTAAAALMTSAWPVVTKIRGVAERARTEVARRTTALDDAIRKDEVELRQLDAGGSGTTCSSCAPRSATSSTAGCSGESIRTSSSSATPSSPLTSGG